MTKTIHKFRQSWLNDVIKCPEMARTKRLELVTDDVQSDSMSLGTATHAGIEEACKQKREGSPIDIELCVQAVEATLDGIRAEGGWTATYSKNDTQVYNDAVQCFLTWEEQIAPLIEPQFIEETFNKLFYADDQREIWLTGTADCIDINGVVWDWKTSGKAYERWEQQRWAIQPTVYCWAFDATEFSYGVMLRGKGQAQIVDVARDEGNFDWLRSQTVAIAKMLEADLDSWPLVDSGWWCSPKWCPNWTQCKGLLIDSEEWIGYGK